MQYMRTTAAKLRIAEPRTSSDSGPQASGPRQYPKTYNEIVRLPISCEKVKNFIMFVIMPDGADEANELQS